MPDIEHLIAAIQEEAQRAEFPIDRPVYEAAGKDPTLPIIYAGNLASKLCFFARDLGKDEVHAGQPLYGAAGTLVRQGVYRAIYDKETKDKTELMSVLERVLLTNTMPYKPPGNKAYSATVKNRFRPFLEKLLLFYWQGDRIITLGNEAFKWFAPYGAKGELTNFFERSDRYSASLPVTIEISDSEGDDHSRQITLFPLPHPSPLNTKYYAQFPQMLQERLKDVEL
ncbi:MAG: uracil-DNA glycosylase [Oscillatoria sp. SIO1A7]|nr:uracil-DNA glycosylase [Oscillatoria sp. SIO1A7]